MDDKKQKSSLEQNGNSLSPDGTDAAELGEDTNAEIISANLRALETVYFTAMLEEGRLFEVMDRLVAMFSRGMLPLGPGRAGAMLYQR